MQRIREPVVADLFYPADPARLRHAVQTFLDVAGEENDAVKALIVPHAGYVYSGPVAGTGYARLRPLRGRVERVVLLGPAHRVPLRGLALPAVDAWRSPLGTVPVDTAGVQALQDLPDVVVDDAAHAAEHSLEVHLPFLQEVLGTDFGVLPLVVGDAEPAAVARVLEAVWGGKETLIVVSSDLSHYMDYDSARRVDAETSRAIERLDVDGIRPDRACGCAAIRGLLTAARDHGLVARVLDQRNSGDTAGSRDQVVGYGAYVLA